MRSKRPGFLGAGRQSGEVCCDATRRMQCWGYEPAVLAEDGKFGRPTCFALTTVVIRRVTSAVGLYAKLPHHQVHVKLPTRRRYKQRRDVKLLQEKLVGVCVEAVCLPFPALGNF